MLEHSARRAARGVREPAETARGETLQLLRENNERTLHLIGKCVAAAGDSPDIPPPLSAAWRDRWNEADAATLTRAAELPTLLLDIRGWETQPSPEPPPRGFFPDLSAVPLMRSTLVLAWHVCRTDTQGAGILLGLPAHSVEALRQLRLHDLERIALTRAHWLRPRWSSQPWMWIELLEAVQAGSVHAFDAFKLRALQLMLGELLQARVER